MAAAAERNLGTASAALFQLKLPLTAEQVATVRQKAEANDVQSQLLLAFYYSSPPQPVLDLPQGYAWFRRAAEAGHREAQSYVGYDLMAGRGVAADPLEAVRWMKRAALRGQGGAQFNLARAYRDGIGIEANPVEAYQWMAQAAERNVRTAKADLVALEATLNTIQMAKAQREVSDWNAHEALEGGQQLASAAAPKAAAAPSPPADPDTLWSVVKRVVPSYPADAERRGQTGRMALLAEIGVDGLPHNVRVIDGTGFARLDAEGVIALQQWRFKTPMPVTAEFRFLFRPGPPPTEEEVWR
jgi:TonB family protein